jgi:hypothetical protein
MNDSEDQTLQFAGCKGPRTLFFFLIIQVCVKFVIFRGSGTIASGIVWPDISYISGESR